jgi:hypothetical protein
MQKLAGAAAPGLVCVLLGALLQTLRMPPERTCLLEK